MTPRQLTSGLYRRLLHNVYADPGLEADHRLHAVAASLVMPSAAVLGGRSAAAWWGAPFASPADAVVVLVPEGSSWRGPRGIRAHRTPLAPSDIVSIDGTRVTGPLRTAWDVATLETVPDAVAMLDAMVRTGHLDLPTAVADLAQSHGRWRASRVEKVLPLVDGRSQSPPESWVRVACVRAGLPVPTPQFVVVEGGEFLGVVDLAWQEARVIVEYEGAYHFDGLQIVKDDARYARLVAAGWRVIRLGAADLRDMEAVVRRIREALRSTAPTV
ncbi:Protein of unknown function [Blastococcus aggregatus]|uniref:DUF559 domain-containing protein n=1 Tax=Blastococcus aggregatus TaxID=38502 RepID=A0A285UY95_9ACTN|nr:Protein of unknown function [Blastococcus aggregatus]